ncbi:membrane-anchored adenylyl cyclase [Mycolicibacterium mageritense DSM 44476 = CIP 104973]|nr:adenylate/guanylate cyclase domain-containing protein [Mycolicibacterium mageritense]MCC9180114.1 AAA family ATPase [Mycolicibacterium mageritense]CDO21840.1 membrane-anchored adenylyl cyclase [Mycolicibacterium mageritense DSM 44476 = CIP 104973]
MAPALACTTCGAELRSGAKFCDECGAPIAMRAVTPAEYKQVTVLFADVVRSMDIAAAVGAERLREIMSELVTRSSAVVRRYGGTVGSFTGDGIMAVFGAPIALEDHALRACLTALGIQDEVARLAVDIQRHDGVDLRLRIGLNSGQVVAGEIGSGAWRYTTIGQQVGLAQRMESVAPPGGVILNESTGRLVEGAAVLAEPVMVHIKGSDQPVCTRRLLGVLERPRGGARTESQLVGRRREMAAVEGLLERAVDGHGAVVAVVGTAGIGKSRLVREVSTMAAVRDVDVFSAFCESHAADVPFRVVARLLRATTGVGELERPAARAQVRAQIPGADPEDMLLFDDLLGIADPDVVPAKIDPDARRRRLTALVNAASLARGAPAVYIIEDAHWIDEASESMLAEFLTVIPQTPSLVLITYRPEYRGALSRVANAQTIALAPLTGPETTALIAQLLGADPSVGELAAMVTARAAGNPFFAEEMVRDLAERGVLHGNRGAYLSTADVGDVTVPATLQATIAARIDRLDPLAKRTLNAAAIVGSQFGLQLLTAVGVEPVVGDLVAAQLIDQVSPSVQAEYVFLHPLIRSVAYESQLKSDRAELHMRVAAAIESGDPSAAEENAALIAQHLEAAGDLRAAYGWHMRAAAWATSRDIVAARRSWEWARTIADSLPTDDPNRAAMRIAPRTMLCGTAYRVRVNVGDAHFDELRQLCTAAGDKASLAIAMAGLVIDHAYQGRVREASGLASETMVLIESLGDPTLTVGLSYPAIYAKFECGHWPDVLRWSQRVIELAEGDPFKGNFIFGSPLALALTSRAMARYYLGLPGWREDLRHGLAVARSADPVTFAAVGVLSYCSGISNGVLAADDRAVHEIEDALRIAERSGNDYALGFARMSLGVALVHRRTAVEHDSGRTLLAEVSDVFARDAHNLGDRPLVDVYEARERARRGDADEAVPLMRAAVDQLVREGQLLAWGVSATGVLVETLLDRGTESDMLEAEAAIDRLSATPADQGLVLRDVWLLRMRALLARAHGDEVTYLDLVNRYGALARSLGFEGHIAWAEAMSPSLNG